MEFQDVLSRRRMVRNYTGEPVDPEVLHRIADAAFKAPSAGYSQGIAVVLVLDPDKRHAIAKLADELEYVAAGFDPWISRAPAHLVLAVSEAAYRDRYSEPDKLRPDGTAIEWPVPYWWVDVGAALMAVLLAVVNEGLSAGFLGVHNIPELGQLLDFPPDYTPIGVVTIGHPAPDRRSGSLKRGRRSRNSVVHVNTWQHN